MLPACNDCSYAYEQSFKVNIYQTQDWTSAWGRFHLQYKPMDKLTNSSTELLIIASKDIIAEVWTLPSALAPSMKGADR